MITLGQITASAVLLQTLARHEALSPMELRGLCQRNGLRAGSLPIAVGLELLVETGLVTNQDLVRLTSAGVLALGTLGGGEEPTPAYRRLMTSLALTIPLSRVSLVGVVLGEDGRVDDPRGIAEPILENLAVGGLADYKDGAWRVAPGAAAYLAGPLLGSDPHQPDTELQTRVGERGEALSIRFETERTGQSPLQVSLVSPAYGFDLLSVRGRGDDVDYAVEVKATTGAALRIYWSRHEAQTAVALENLYEIQVWGEVVLERDVEEEYESLREQGYPRRVRNPARFAGSPLGDSLKWVLANGTHWTTSAFAWDLTGADSKPDA